MDQTSWLLLLYSLPTQRNTERVAVWRRLKRLGAVQLNDFDLPAAGSAGPVRAFPMAGETDSRLAAATRRSCARRRSKAAATKDWSHFSIPRAMPEYADLKKTLQPLADKKEGATRSLASRTGALDATISRASRDRFFRTARAAHEVAMFLRKMERKKSQRRAAATQSQKIIAKDSGKLVRARRSIGSVRPG